MQCCYVDQSFQLLTKMLLWSPQMSGLNKMLLWSPQFYQCSVNCDYSANKLIRGTIMSLLGMLLSQQLIQNISVHAAFFELCCEPCYAIIVFLKIKLYQKLLVSPSMSDKIGPLTQPLSNYVHHVNCCWEEGGGEEEEDRHVKNISYTRLLSQLNPVNINTLLFENKENSFKMSLCHVIKIQAHPRIHG